MPKLIPLRFEEVCRKLKKLWFEGPKAGGRHMYMWKGSQMFPIPRHGGKEVSIGVLRLLIRVLEISVEEWNNL